MRNLDECKAEIFRLGDKKIKQRKKRRMRTLSVCVPLCLCLVVWSVTLLPAMLPAKTADGNDSASPQLKFENETSGTVQMKYTQMYIKGLGEISFYQHIKEPLKTNYVAGIIDGFYENASDGATGNGADTPNYQIPEAQQSGYLILFTAGNDLKVEYTLLGYVLKNNTTGDSIVLTDLQRTQLLSELTGGD